VERLLGMDLDEVTVVVDGVGASDSRRGRPGSTDRRSVGATEDGPAPRSPRGAADEVGSHRLGRRLLWSTCSRPNLASGPLRQSWNGISPRVTPNSTTADFARGLVSEVVEDRERIDELIARLAPQYPVVQLARMDRTLLRSGIGEVPTLRHAVPGGNCRVVELARTYSGEPARRLVNGVSRRITRDSEAGAHRAPDSGAQ